MPDTIGDAQEHPIIFNEWSIQRILAGEKTQTRRVVKPQPPHPEDVTSYGSGDPVEEVWKYTGLGGKTPHEPHVVERPYMPGDVLWVREPFRMPVGCDDKYTPKEYVSSSGYTHGVPGRFRYEADGKRAYEVAGNRDACAVEWGRKRPPIHMPRELCRLRLRVEDVRVEQVQQISQEDAIAEGIPGDYVHGEEDREYTEAPHVCGPKYGGSAITEFRRLWNDIHGDGAWERNDWVWVIEFSQIDNA
jgi:hypothetical protein